MKVKRKKRIEEPIYGVGINDADYDVYVVNVIDGKKTIVWFCPYYKRWTEMLKRCYSENYLVKKPSYIGCTCCRDWLRFTTFKAWMEQQDWKGKHLDKDVLFLNNKVYSPETCVFISSQLNSFLTNSKSKGVYPVGVVRNKSGSKRFVAQCQNIFQNKRESLGTHYLPEHAHMAWLLRKRDIAVMYANQGLGIHFTTDRVSESLLERFSLGVKESIKGNTQTVSRAWAEAVGRLF